MNKIGEKVLDLNTSSGTTFVSLFEDKSAQRVELAQLGWRAFEIFAASMALIVGLPAMLVIAFIIKRGSRGPVLFFQDRVGKGGKTFKFVKFRTMYVDARERFPELYSYKYSDEQIKDLAFKIKDDPRVTPQGKWLRKSTLDELPNFWNVLTGDMSLVGPRPDIPQMLPYYQGHMLEKFDVRPGVTGLAQVSGRGNLGFHDTVDLDVEYVRKKSVSLDFALLVKTVKSVFLRDGAF